MNIDEPLKSQFPALRLLWKEAFGDTDDFLNTFFTTAFHTGRCRCITINDNVAAALYWFDCLHKNKRVAYIYAVATAKAFRGQGLCHQLMEDTHRHLASLGYEGAILVPGNKDLFQFYEEMGYQICCHINKIACSAADTKKEIFLRPIDKTEFAALRRKFLPEGSIIQEKENLDFLETQARFYTGDHFLLAARIEENTLRGVELLGETCYAGEIVNCLGCSKGIFRTPGDETPFAMYYPLACSELPPVYFGFPFD